MTMTMTRTGYKRLGLMLLLLMMPFGLWAQTAGVLRGLVTDEEREPLPGANVSIVKGGQTIIGGVTDIDGHFELTGVPADATMKVSFVGFKPQTMAPNFRKEMRIVLHEDNKIDEVMVNGYFTRTKETFTGSAATYSGEQILELSPVNLFQALSVLDAGLTITVDNAAGSNPNAVPELIIRSTTSLATNDEVGLNAPLIIIDGVESTLQALYDIDLQDILRVDILKDASATALYGENAANGVIIIERKRVTQSPVRIRYTFTPQLSFADLSSYEVCNAAQKLELERLSGLYSSNSGSKDQLYYDRLALVSQGLDTDWMSKPIRNSFSHMHSVTVSGRGSGLDYNITGNYGDTRGVMKGDLRNRYSMSVYLSYRPVEKLVLTLRAQHQGVGVKDSPYGTFSDYAEANPYDSPYDEFGYLARTLSYSHNNPLYEASLSSFSKQSTRTESLSLDARYNFRPTLYVTGQVSYTTSRGTSDRFLSPRSNAYTNVTNLAQRGSYTLGNTGTDNITGKLVGNWIHHFNDRGTMFTLNAGGEIKRMDSYARSLTGTGFLSDELSDIAYATNYPDGSSPSGTEDLSTSVGVFAGANYTYLNRYVADASYRLSGSSKFGSNNRYAPFWSAGLGYNVHNEEWAKRQEWLDMLRLRMSYGYTGSVKFNAYQAETTYAYDGDHLHYTGVGAIPLAMSNPNLSWQTTKKFNIGLNSSFLKERLNLTLDFYHERTTDMLIDVSLPPSSGATSVKHNLGSQTARGVEFKLWGKLLHKGDWDWNVTWNGLHQRTTITGISNALKRMNEANAADMSSAAPRIQFREGESPTSIYAVRSAGIDPASGKEIFIKQDGSYTYTYSAEDQVRVGDLCPKLQGSLSTTLRWRQLSLNMAFSYRFGGDIYNATRAGKVENINPEKNADIRAFTGRWKQSGDVVPYLDIATVGGQSFVKTDRFVERDNQIYLSALTLQYQVPDKLCRKYHLQKCMASIGTEELFRLSTVRYERGTSYPYSRSVNMSLSLTF